MERTLLTLQPPLVQLKPDGIRRAQRDQLERLYRLVLIEQSLSLK